MRSILQQLRAPFPDRSNPKQHFWSLVGIGLFVSTFLFLIRPFGMGRMNLNLFWVCLGFGGVTVLFGWLYDLFNRKVLCIRTDVPSWTLGKWVLQSMGIILWVALGNYLYMNLLSDWALFDGEFLLQMLGNTLFIGIFPIVFSGLTIQLRATKANQQEAQLLHPELHHQHQEAEASIVFKVNASEEVAVAAPDLRYAEAQQNYVLLAYLEEGALKTVLLRQTIASLETQVQQTGMIRCHRSFLVNSNTVEQVSGNAQGLKLQLMDVPEVTVPVSRSYMPQVKERLR